MASGASKAIGAVRRAGIYGLLSYSGLVLINNSGLELSNMWVAYLPMFIAVYVLTQWADRRWLMRQQQNDHLNKKHPLLTGASAHVEGPLPQASFFC